MGVEHSGVGLCRNVSCVAGVIEDSGFKFNLLSTHLNST